MFKIEHSYKERERKRIYLYNPMTGDRETYWESDAERLIAKGYYRRPYRKRKPGAKNCLGNKRVYNPETFQSRFVTPEEAEQLVASGWRLGTGLTKEAAQKREEIKRVEALSSELPTVRKRVKDESKYPIAPMIDAMSAALESRKKHTNWMDLKTSGAHYELYKAGVIDCVQMKAAMLIVWAYQFKGDESHPKESRIWLAVLRILLSAEKETPFPILDAVDICLIQGQTGDVRCHNPLVVALNYVGDHFFPSII